MVGQTQPFTNPIDSALRTITESPRLVTEGLGLDIGQYFMNPAAASGLFRALSAQQVQIASSMATAPLAVVYWSGKDICRCGTSQLSAVVLAYILRYLAEYNRSGNHDIALAKAKSVLGSIIASICNVNLGPPTPGGKLLSGCTLPGSGTPPTPTGCDWWNEVGTCKWNDPNKGMVTINDQIHQNCTCDLGGKFTKTGCLPWQSGTKEPKKC
jgi:hypothetical protein